MTTPVLRLRDVGVAYNGVPVVEGVSLDVSAGQWLGFIGPNGAGKSSLLRAIAGLVPHSGAVELGAPGAGGPGIPGRPRRRGRQRAKQVALVPQTPMMPQGVTVADYVLLGRTPHIPYLGVEQHHDVEVVRAVLQRLALERFSARSLDTLSGGERQRAVIARALAQEAPLLLLDEPTNGLDVGSQQQVLELVAELCTSDGLTVVSAMHDLTLAGQFADRLAMISRRGLVASGPACEVLTEAGISEHYGANVRVLRDVDGSVIVIPTRAGPTRAGPTRAGTTRAGTTHAGSAARGDGDGGHAHGGATNQTAIEDQTPA